MITALALSSLLLAPQEPAQVAAQPAAQDGFFGLDKIWDIHIHVAEGDWAKMFPEGGFRFGFAQQRPKFPYIRVRAEIAGHEPLVIGMRFKGHSTFSGTRGTLKRPFKLDFDRFVAKQTFLGLKKLSLNNNSTDGTQIKEAVAYKLFRDAGVVASRTAFARVYVTIDGGVQRGYVGLYTLIEQVDQGLLKRQTKHKGTILKPETQILGYHGDTWDEKYEGTYLPKSTVVAAHQKLMVDVARLAESVRSSSGGGGGRAGGVMRRGARFKPFADDAARRRFVSEFERLMDVDQFFRFAALNALVCNSDTPLSIAHNVYLVIPRSKQPTQDKVLWVPWDLNLIMAGRSARTSNALVPGRIPFVQAVLSIDSLKERYRKQLRELVDGPCSAERWQAAVRLARQTTADALRAEADRPEAVTRAAPDPGARRGFGGGGGFRRRTDEDVAAFAADRVQFVRDLLEGKVEPPVARGFGFGNRGARRPPLTPAANAQRVLLRLVRGRFAPDAPLAADAVVATAVKRFAAFDKDASGALERAELRSAVEAVGRPAFGQPVARTTSRHVLRRLDSDRNGKLSAAEWRAGVRSHFTKWDKDKDGKLSTSEWRPTRAR